MKTTKIILLTILFGFSINTQAQVAINKDGSTPATGSILHIKGDNVGTPVEAMFIESATGNIGIGTTSPDASAALEVLSTASGFLPPRLTTAQRNAISNPAEGLTIYNTDNNDMEFYNGSRWRGFYLPYSEQVICGNEFTDGRDGEVYKTIQIGNQCWMAENLNIGIRIDGNVNQTNNNIFEKYCFDNHAPNCITFGGLYQWNEMMQFETTEGVQGICPDGWHLPTDDEWKIMEMHLGMTQAQADAIGWRGTGEGGKMKEEGTTHWFSPNTGATNSSGLTTLPGGYRSSNGSFYQPGYNGIWWSSTEYSGTYAWYRSLYYLSGQVRRSNNSKTSGFSVRCLKN